MMIFVKEYIKNDLNIKKDKLREITFTKIFGGSMVELREITYKLHLVAMVELLLWKLFF
jgi:hypothetical protein